MLKLKIKSFKEIIKSWFREDSSSLYLSFCKIPIKILSKIFLALTPTIIISSIENRSNLTSVLLKIFIVCLILTLLLLFDPIIDEKINFASTKLKYFYKKKLFKEAVNRIDNEPANTSINRILNFVDMNYKYCVQNFPNKMINLLSNLVGLLSYIVLFRKLNSVLVIILVLTSFIDFYVLLNFHDILTRNENKISPIKSQLNYLYFLSKDFSAGKELRLYNFRDWFMNIHNTKLNSYKTLLHDQNNKAYKLFFIITTSKFIRDSFIILMLLYKLYNRDFLVSDFVFFGTLAIGFSDWIKNIAQDINELLYICNEHKQFSLYFSKKNTSFFRNKIHINKNQLIETIEFNHVSFSYPNSTKPIIKDISFKITKNENVAIVGRNGCGKSTCIKLLCGLLKPTSGSISLNGIDIYDFYEEEYIELFSTIFQHFHILPTNIAENICLCDKLYINTDKLKQSINLSGFDKTLIGLKDGIYTNLVEEINKDGIRLSGGEQQKLVLARVLYKDSPIIILDEPTAALDPLSENEIYQKYRQLSKNKITLFVSHRLASGKFCDKILVIDNGVVAEIGTHNDLIKLKGIYYNLYKIQKDSFNRGK